MAEGKEAEGQGCAAKYAAFRDSWAEAQNGAFAKLGGQLSRTPWAFVVVPMLLFALLAIGMMKADVESDPVQLWVQKGSRLEDEKEEYEGLFGDLPRVVGIQLSDENVLSHQHLDRMYALDEVILNMQPHLEKSPAPICANLTEEKCTASPVCFFEAGKGCLLNDMHQVLPSVKQAGAVTAEYLGVRWGMRELCMESFSPTGNRMPCSRQHTPMDCLREPPASLYPQAPREWEQIRDVSRYADLVNISRAVSGVCRMWNGAPHAKGYSMGGLEYGASGELSRVKYWKLFYPMAPPMELVRKYAYIMSHPVSGKYYRQLGYPEAITEEDAEEILERFDIAVDEAMAEQSGVGRLTWMTRWKIEELVDEATVKNTHFVGVALALLIAVVWGTLFRTNMVTSRLLLGLGAVVVVCVGVAGMMGFMALCGVPYNGLSLRVLPYVALGLGIDDMFVLLHYFDEDPSTPVAPRMERAYAHGGPSVTATSLVNLVVFLLGLWIPVQAVQDFALQAAVGVIFNYFGVLFSFGGLLALDAHRIFAHRVDIAVCMKGERPTEGPGSRLAHNLAKTLVIPAVTHKLGQAVVVLITLALLGVAGWGCSQVELGLALSELVEDGVEKDYLEGRAELTTESNFLMGREGAWESPQFQMKLNHLVSFAMMHPNNTFGIPGGKLQHADKSFWIALPSWSTNFRWFALQFAMGWAASNDPCKCGIEGGETRRAVLPPDCIVDPEVYLDLLGVYLGILPCRAANETSAPPPPKCSATAAETAAYLSAAKAVGLPTCKDVQDKYNSRSVAPGTLYLPDVFVRKGRREDGGAEVRKISGWRITLLNNPAEQSMTDANLRTMEETRALLDDSGLPIYTYGPTYLFNEQYRYSKENLRNMLVVMLCVAFVLMSVLMASVRLGFLQTLVIGMSMVSVVATLPAFGLKLNSMSLLSTVFGVGINVEMTIHISRSFLMAQGGRSERVAKAMIEMSAPVAAGGLTTFFGVLVLAFSGTAFLRNYFFGYISAMVALALFHSFGALPVLLFWFGPPPLPPHTNNQTNPTEPIEETGRFDKVVSFPSSSDGQKDDPPPETDDPSPETDDPPPEKDEQQ